MYEKVNPAHPDKVADRIAGALVDYAYAQEENPRIAVEVLLGHGMCHIIAETSVLIPQEYVEKTVRRVAGDGVFTDYVEVPQDATIPKAPASTRWRPSRTACSPSTSPSAESPSGRRAATSATTPERSPAPSSTARARCSAVCASGAS